MFDKSEEYRKYIIKLQFFNKTFYAIWGVNENGDDCFLTKDNSLVVFDSLEDVKKNILKFERDFFDKEKFKKWITLEIYGDYYNATHIDILLKIEYGKPINGTSAIKLLNTINIIEDFALQINSESILKIYNNPTFIKYKDILYNIYFWDAKNVNSKKKLLIPKSLVQKLKSLYDIFESKLTY